MTGYRTRNKANPQKGISLILALLALLLISAIATGIVMMTNTETNISANFRDEQSAFFAARGGVEESRDRLRPAATNTVSGLVPTVVAGNTNGVLYVTNPTGSEVVAPWSNTNAYYDKEICNEVQDASCNSNGFPGGSPWYTTTTASAAYAATPTLPWKWARITLKTNSSSAPDYVNGSSSSTTLNNPICWNGGNEFVLPSGTANCQSASPPSMPVYLLTSYAMTPSGTHRMVQSEVTLVTFPPLPGALTFDGPSPNFSSPHSMPYHINGQDGASPACPPAGNKPAIAGYDTSSTTTLLGDLFRPDHYSGYPPGSFSPVAPSVSNTGPTAPPPANTMGPLATVSGLQNLVSAVTNIADQVVPPGGSPPLGLGTAATPLVTVAQGDLTVGPGTGYGILVVQGNLTMNGNTSWNGAIIVVGNGSLTVSGGGSGQINGGILVANINSGVSGNTPGPPTVNWTGGGGNGIYYNSCDVNSLFNTRTGYFRMVATRELMY